LIDHLILRDGNYRAYEREKRRGGSVGTSVRGPEIQEGVYEYLKGPIALAIDVLL
jgi:hypothetical protein